MKLNTVNVIELVSDFEFPGITGLMSFSDDQPGNRAAEKQFRKLALENGARERDLESYIEDGYYTNGTRYVLLIIHSTN